jgi:hypothetical protein
MREFHAWRVKISRKAGHGKIMPGTFVGFLQKERLALVVLRETSEIR